MLTVDYFAGGGGTSRGIFDALGEEPNVAINHCPLALAMHRANHPTTTHLQEDVWDVDPNTDIPPGDIDLAWFSPSCTTHSKARAGKPVSKQLRASPWVAARLAKHRRPRVIIIENVPEFRKWGPCDKDGNPIKARFGQTYKAFVQRFRTLGYDVQERVLDAADYGVPTHRKRLFLIARADGHPIVWPEPSHGPGRKLPYRTAAECIDWSLPSLSIFATKAEATAFSKEHKLTGGRKRRGTPKRPLEEATLRRIAEGMKRFVLESPKPFVVQCNHGRDTNRSRQLSLPMWTVTAKHGVGLVIPTLVQTGHGERDGQSPRIRDINRPFSTVVAGTGGQPALVSAFLTKYHGPAEGRVRAGQEADAPLHTITTAPRFGVVTAFVTKFYGTSTGSSVEEPAPTISAQGQHAGLVSAFLVRYFGQSIGQSVEDPAPTATGCNHTALVTVVIDGETYVIVDICLRMLSPRELARCQGFEDAYQLTGNQEQQVARIGNSVPPPIVAALVRANVPRPRNGRRAA